MKKIGIVRAIDKLGRIVIPMEMRVLLDMAEVGTEVEISQEGQRIIIEKHLKSCRFCDSTEDLLDFKGKKSGRGAYLCHNPACFAKAVKARRLQSALECEIPENIIGAIEKELTVCDG